MKIKTIDDVLKFFDYLIKERKTIFHPDDSFDQYINMETGEQTFTDEECKEFDEAMEQCFRVCEECKENIYGIGLRCVMNMCDLEKL